MELDDLRALSTVDQQTFLLGRIANETTSMEAALRLLHGALRGQHDLDAFLDAPTYMTTIAKECKALTRDHEGLDDKTRAAVASALNAAAKAYARRNRFVHDLLRTDLLDEGWRLLRLARPDDGDVLEESTSFEDMVSIVLELITAKWRLRGCAFYVLNGSWQGMVFGEVTGSWDGTADSYR